MPLATPLGQSTERRVAVALLAVALLLGTTLNWERFLLAPLSIDEHVSFWIADRSSPGSLLERSFQYSATPPLWFILGRLSLDLCGPSEWAMRLPAAAAYLAAVVAVCWVGWKTASPLAGGLAALLLAVHPGISQLAVAARPYSIGMLLAVLAMYCTERLVLAGNSLGRWVAWILLNLMLIQTHYLFGALWAAQIIWFSRAINVPRRQKLLSCVLLAAMVLSVAPGLLQVWQHREYLNWTTRTAQVTDLLQLVLPVDWVYFRQPIWWPFYWGVVALPIVWQVVFRRIGPGSWIDRVRWQQCSRLLARAAVWLLVPAGGMWLLGRFWIESLAAGRYQVICVPASALLLGTALCLWRGVTAPVLGAVGLVLLEGLGPRLAAVIPRPTAGVIRSASPADAAWKDVGLMVAAADPPPDLVLVGSGLTEMTLVPAYYNNPKFQDYVCSRLGRMYQQRSAVRLSLPMFWPKDWVGFYNFYEQASARVCKSARQVHGPEAKKVGSIWLIAATDTDLLRNSAARAQQLLESTGAIKLQRIERDHVLLVVIYACPPAAVLSASARTDGSRVKPASGDHRGVREFMPFPRETQ